MTGKHISQVACPCFSFVNHLFFLPGDVAKYVDSLPRDDQQNDAEGRYGNRSKSDVQRGLAWGTKRGTFDEPAAPADVRPRLKA